jgi:hypothetical protein
MMSWAACALGLYLSASTSQVSGTISPPATPADLRPKPLEHPPSTADIDLAIGRGIDFLVHNQNADGSWGTAQRTKDLNIYAPMPDSHLAYRSAVTALCVAGLIDTHSPRPDVVRAIERGENWLEGNLPGLRRATTDVLYNIWGHIYGIQALVRMHERIPGDSARRKHIEDLIRGQMDLLRRYESIDGGWGYYDFRVGAQRPATDSTSFMTAAGLVALREARDIGVPVDEKLLHRAIDSIHRQEKKDFSYLYGEYLKWRPFHPINRPGGSLGRSQACNLALRLWGDPKITDAVLETWLDRLISRNLWLDLGRKRPIPHESWFAVAGYFFYFGHYYGAGCIVQLPAAERPFYQAHLANILLKLQEKDGSWWDYPLYNYHQQYGTGFALMTLAHCKP